LISLSLAISLATVAQASPAANLGPTPLLDKVRAATDRFWDVNVALHEGFVPATPCVSGPSEGAMGVHFVLPARLGDGIQNAAEPEALIYEPQSNGSLRFVGVEFIALASSVQSAPSLEGHLMNYVGEPNRYGLPAFYEMHVWAWQDNPKGSFADWNTSVTCDAQRTLDRAARTTPARHRRFVREQFVSPQPRLPPSAPPACAVKALAILGSCAAHAGGAPSPASQGKEKGASISLESFPRLRGKVAAAEGGTPSQSTNLLLLQTLRVTSTLVTGCKIIPDSSERRLE